MYKQLSQLFKCCEPNLKDKEKPQKLNLAHNLPQINDRQPSNLPINHNYVPLNDVQPAQVKNCEDQREQNERVQSEPISDKPDLEDLQLGWYSVEEFQKKLSERKSQQDMPKSISVKMSENDDDDYEEPFDLEQHLIKQKEENLIIENLIKNDKIKQEQRLSLESVKCSQSIQEQEKFKSLFCK